MLIRFLYWLSLALSLVCVGLFENVVVRGDADFESVRVRLNKDHSGKRGDPKEKYFREPPPSCSDQRGQTDRVS